MPQLFKVGRFVVYFWSNESLPAEPVHVHVSEGVPTANATKFWLTEKGKALLQNNNSKINARDLSLIQKVIEANSDYIIREWESHFETIRFFC